MNNLYGNTNQGGNNQMMGYGNQQGNMLMPQSQPTMSVVTITDPQSVNWYPIAANSTVFFVDFNGGALYIKSKNEMGIPMPVRTFDLHERVQQPVQQTQPSNAVSREEFNELKKMLEDLTAPSK